MVLKDIFLGRQPILNRKQEVTGFELLFRSADTDTAGITDYHHASASVIIHAIMGFGLEEVLGKHTGFINVTEDVLMSESIELLPSERVVVELLETIKVNKEIVKRCSYLKDKGFKLALDDFSYDSSFDPLLEVVDIVKIDLMMTSDPALIEYARRFKGKPVNLLAEKVETVEQFNRCMDLGFEMFQGYYFARPVVLNRKNIDVAKLTLLKLLRQTLSDVDTREIESTFKESPTLSYNLIRLVNSVAMGMRRKIGTINHAIVILGRKQLRRWVQLLLYTYGAATTTGNPLLEMAAFRGKLLELLAQARPARTGSDYPELAFMTGILSLIDTLIGIPMEDVLKQINLDEEVRLALLTRKGYFGQLLKLCEGLEAGDFQLVNEHMKELGIELEQLNSAELAAMNWINGLSES